MKNLKSNRYEKAVNEIKNLDESLVEKIKSEIKESDKGYFHVAMVKIHERAGSVKNDVSVTTQPFGLIQFEKLQKNYQFLGYNKLILVHDPRLETQDEFVGETKKVVPMSKEELDELIEQRVQERMDAREQLEGKSKEELIEKVYGNTVKEMKIFADLKEIDLTGLIKKEDIEGAIDAWLELEAQSKRV